MRKQTSWRALIERAMSKHNETFADTVVCTCWDELNVLFENGYGTGEGSAFTLWTTKRVYFPAYYDGRKWVASVPRNPCDEVTNPIGQGWG